VQRLQIKSQWFVGARTYAIGMVIVNVVIALL